MTDVFDRLVGQDRATDLLRQYARNPVHAYLLSGPVGSSLHDALITFAAALQCPSHGCGSCEVCLRVLGEHDADTTTLERSGVSWRIDELREADRISRRRPLGDGYQIVILEDIELTTTGSSPSAAALLKSLEEPPLKTIFLLSAQDVPPALDTIVSRCVEVRLRSLGEQDLEVILRREGAPAEVAHAAAVAAAGNLRRARVLVGDPGLGERIAQWREIPERLNGTPARASQLALEISRSLDAAIAPLQRVQEDELARRDADAREMGQRGVANRKDVEAQFKREQRRFRTDELHFGLSALTNVYRERMTTGLEEATAGDTRAEYRIGSSMRAIDAISTTAQRLSQNVDEGLALNDLLLTLMDA